MFNRAYVEITDVCNLACSFCPGTRRPAGYMRPEDFRRLAEHIFLEQAEKFDWPDPEAPESGTEFCHGLRQQLAVLWDGTVVPCCLDGDGRMALGNLYTSSVEEILASPRAAAIREGFSRRQPSEELCRRCGYAARF